MDVDLVKLKLAYDDRINRKIPNPAGMGFISKPWELEQQQEARGTVARVILILGHIKVAFLFLAVKKSIFLLMVD